MEDSLVNKRWVEELAKYPERYTIHELHKVYPDEKIDVQKEQKLIESYDKIIFQFPFYWYSSPSFLKKWIDEVLLHGWAYGSKSGHKVAGKKIGLAITAGGDEEGYSESGSEEYTMREYTRPFKRTFDFIKADYKGLFVQYGIEYNTSEEFIEEGVPKYIDFIEKI